MNHQNHQPLHSTLNNNRSAPLRIKGVRFSLFGPDEITKESVVQVEETSLYQKGMPREGGLADHRLGPTDRSITCGTCRQSVENCNGHFGHIILPVPCYSAFFLVNVMKILRSVCFFCSRFLIPTHITDPETGKKKKNPKMVIITRRFQQYARFNILTKMARLKNVCPHCDALQPTYTKCINQKQFCISREWPPESLKQWEPVSLEEDPNEATRNVENERRLEEKKMATKPFTSIDAYNILKHMNTGDIELFGMDPKVMHPKKFMITVLKVPPPVIRPSVMASEGSRSRGQNDLTRKLLEIVKHCHSLDVLLKENPQVFNEAEELPKEIAVALQELQYHVATYMNNPIRGLKPSTTRSGAHLKGLLQRIKGKGGRIRGNITGKRVDFSARTVVSPDPNLDIDQVGVPKRLAEILTLEERVTPFNIEALQARVLVGAKNIKGAHIVCVTLPNGGVKTIYLEFMHREDRARLRLEYGNVVERYIQDNDYVLFNRQPSLHKKSLMAHRVKIMPIGDTFRLNLSVVTPYNADFDGDEMNLHQIQGLLGRAELSEIIAVNRQALNAQTNRPTFGLVQDALTGAYRFTRKNSFVTREQVMNLMMTAEKTMEQYNPNWKLPQPAILKPQPLWTGKQVFSMLFPPGINLSKQVRGANSYDPMDLPERSVLIQNGVLVHGALCKATVGSSTGGVVHIICKDHSMDKACLFLSDAQRLVNKWMLDQGFTVGISDCIVPKQVDDSVRDIIHGAYECIEKINTDLKAEEEQKASVKLVSKEDIEEPVAEILRGVINKTGELVQSQMTDENHINAMACSGSKGNPINLSQIMACVGQQTIDGRRIHVKNSLHERTRMSTRVLTCYAPGDEHPETHGFCPNSYVIGQEPEEMFMHAMGGREGLVDTAVKTSVTGYIQRRLLKAMEALQVKFDGTVRNAEGYIVEFLYGNDGMDAQYLEPSSLFLVTLSDEELLTRFQDHHFLSTLHPNWKRVNQEEIKTLFRLRDECRRAKTNLITGEIDTTVLLPVHIPRLILGIEQSPRGTQLITPTVLVYLQNSFLEKMHQRFKHSHKNTEGYYQGMLFLEAMLKSYISCQRVCYKWTKEMLMDLFARMEHLFQSSSAEAGDMVGALASEAIGEPATQLSFLGDTPLVYWDNDAETSIVTTIGEWVEEMMNDNDDENEVVHLENSDTYVVQQQPSQYYIPSVDAHGSIAWRQVTGWTKHPPNGKLIHVRTLSGRSVTATLAKSFLIHDRVLHEFVPVNGSDLKVGDLLPVTVNLPAPPVDHKEEDQAEEEEDQYEYTYEKGLLWGAYLVSDSSWLYHDALWKTLQSMKIPCVIQGSYITFPGDSLFIHFVETLYDVVESRHEWLLGCSSVPFLTGVVAGFTLCEQGNHAPELAVKRTIHLIQCRLGTVVKHAGAHSCVHDCILDPVISITTVDCPDPYVYDITVEDTYNFMIHNGLHVRDTLNTFHYSGVGNKNTTTGVPRLRELIDVTKSEKMKTPSLTIALQPQYAMHQEAASNLKETLISTSLGDLVKEAKTVWEPDVLHTTIAQDEEMVRVSSVFRNHILLRGASRWIIRLVLFRSVVLNRGLTPMDLANTIREFIGPRADVVYSPTNAEEWVIRLTLYDIRDMAKIASSVEADQIFQERIMTQTEMNRLLAKITVGGIEGLQDASLRQITRYHVDTRSKGLTSHKEYVIDTRGTALSEVWTVPGVDYSRTWSNDLYEIYENLGIEAVAQVLFHEIKAVLADSYVNDRHIMAVVKTMCFRGYLMPMSRHGINRVDTGVLMRVSFEESMEQLMNAAMFNEVDQLKGVTENMMVGALAPMGTGTVQLLVKDDYKKQLESVVYGRERIPVVKKLVYRSMITEWKTHVPDDLDYMDRPPSPPLDLPVIATMKTVAPQESLLDDMKRSLCFTSSFFTVGTKPTAKRRYCPSTPELDDTSPVEKRVKKDKGVYRPSTPDLSSEPVELNVKDLSDLLTSLSALLPRGLC
jgi:DNA-directed RNA polymerase beta' subunit